eukprot:2353287-Alexandrium_andersonii.AAC.1
MSARVCRSARGAPAAFAGACLMPLMPVPSRAFAQSREAAMDDCFLIKDTSETSLTVLALKDRDSPCDSSAPSPAQGSLARGEARAASRGGGAPSA